MKEVNIGKYIEDYELRRITISEIAVKEKVSIPTVKNRLDKYYEQSENERPDFEEIRKRQIEIIKKYIKDYEDRKISAQEIADKERFGYKTVLERIHEYYEAKGTERPSFRGARRKNIDVEKYIKEYEQNNISITEIRKKEGVSFGVVKKNIDIHLNNQCEDKTSDTNNTQIRRKISGATRRIIKDFIKRGLSKEEIRESAEKRNIFISDELFDQLYKEIEDREGEQR